MEGRTPWIINDYNRTVYNASFSVIVVGGITYSYITTVQNVENTPSDDIITATPVVAMTNAVATVTGTSSAPCFACAVSISASAGGALIFTFLQQGIR